LISFSASFCSQPFDYGETFLVRFGGAKHGASDQGPSGHQPRDAAVLFQSRFQDRSAAVQEQQYGLVSARFSSDLEQQKKRTLSELESEAAVLEGRS
jgi:hypothetical protein